MQAQTSSGTATSKPYMPLEIIQEVLLNIPSIELITTFRCVCTSWKALIETSPALKYYSTTGLQKPARQNCGHDAYTASTTAITPMAITVISLFWRKAARKALKIEDHGHPMVLRSLYQQPPNRRNGDTLEYWGPVDEYLAKVIEHLPGGVLVDAQVEITVNKVAGQFEYIFQVVPITVVLPHNRLELKITPDRPLEPLKASTHTTMIYPERPARRWWSAPFMVGQMKEVMVSLLRSRQYTPELTRFCHHSRSFGCPEPHGLYAYRGNGWRVRCEKSRANSGYIEMPGTRRPTNAVVKLRFSTLHFYHGPPTVVPMQTTVSFLFNAVKPFRVRFHQEVESNNQW
ncbi:hypothetical protein TWF696_003801 [Orbilia brochopaga]|uniref:F-box domain-containing protein n=1 Tax=Orbilia brochopaga TaxID=3140254 RepID=A0AAV9VAQ0_9PEZI